MVFRQAVTRARQTSGTATGLQKARGYEVAGVRTPLISQPWAYETKHFHTQRGRSCAPQNQVANGKAYDRAVLVARTFHRHLHDEKLHRGAVLVV
eukprot:514424-Prymnesium_polylepis.2